MKALTRLFAVVAFVCVAAPAVAQYTTVTTASMGGTPAIANATEYWQPVTGCTGGVAAARVGASGGQISGVPLQATVTAGASSLPVPDALATSPSIGYAFTVIDNVSGITLIGAGLQPDGIHVKTGGAYGCVQPTGATWNFDTFIPGTTAATGLPLLNWRGAWVSGTSYAVGDAVGQGGSSYANSLAGNTNTPPGDGWSVLAAGGTNGSAATVSVGTTTTGAPGTSASVANSGTSGAAVLDFTIPQGATGTAATVSTGTTTTGAPGSSATVTNSGSSSAAVFDFGIPQGQTGMQGAAGSLSPNDYVTLATLLPNYPSYGAAATGFILRGAYYGLGRKFSPTTSVTLDVINIPIDTAPSAGFTAASPSLTFSIYDVTTTAYVVNQTLSYSQWSGALTTGLLQLWQGSPLTLAAGDTYEAILETNTLGLGFPQATINGDISSGGRTASATSDPTNVAWDWTYSTAALAFYIGRRSTTLTGAPTSIAGVRQYNSTATNVDTALGAAGTGQTYTTIYGWAMGYTATSTTTFNVVGIRPFGTITNNVSVDIRDASGRNVLAHCGLTAAEWNYYIGTEFKCPLDHSVTVAAAATIIPSMHAYGAAMSYTSMALNSEVTTQRYQITSGAAASYTSGVPGISASTSPGHTIYFHLYSDPAPATNAISTQPGVSALTTTINTTSTAPSASVTGSTGTVAIPTAAVPGVMAGLIPNTDFNAIKAATTTDWPIEAFAFSAWFSRNTQRGLGRVLTPSAAITFDNVWVPLDTSPTGGVPAFEALNPQLQFFIYDVTTATSVFQQTLPCSQWCAQGFAAGGLTWRMPAGSVTLAAGDTYRIGIESDQLGMGWASSGAGVSTYGGFPGAYQADQSTWSTWTYTGGYLALAFMRNAPVALMPVAQAALAGVRSWSTPPTLVSTSLAAAGSSAAYSGIYVWGTKFNPATTWSNVNVIGIRPYGTVTGPVRLQCLTADLLQLFTFGDVTAAEYNAAANAGTELYIKLAVPFTASSGVPFYCYFHGFGQSLSQTNMAQTSETVGDRYDSSAVIDYSHALPTLTLAATSGSVVYMHFYNAAGTQSAGVSITTAQLEYPLFGTPSVVLPRNLYALVGGTPQTVNVTSAVRTGTTSLALVLTSAITGAVVGGSVQVQNVTCDTTMNGFWYITSVTDSTHIAVSSTGNPASCGAAGTVTLLPEELNLYCHNILLDRWCQSGAIAFAANWGVAFGDRTQVSNFWNLQPGNTTLPAQNITSGTFGLTVYAKDNSGATQSSATTTVNLVTRTAATPVNFLAIGDSKTDCVGGKWEQDIVAVIPAVTMLGTRTYDSGVTGCEGKGGWKLSDIAAPTASAQFMTAGNSDGLDSPFVFPTSSGSLVSGYLGNTAWWAAVVNGTNTYQTNGYQQVAKGWTGSTFLYNTSGYPISPTTGQYVFDPAQAAGAKFQQWNGSAWVANSPQPDGWKFDFASYMSRFSFVTNLSTINFVNLNLGTNDCAATSSPSACAAQFVANAQTVATSIHAYNSAIKVLIDLGDSGSTQSGFAIAGTISFNQFQYQVNMQALNAAIIANFDTTAQNTAKVWVANWGLGIDPNNGGFGQVIQNCSKYDSTQCTIGGSNSLHPSFPVGYKQAADSLAAMIQALR